jgi:class 3 adenylate cyclase/tetratricopeptide (TPR) repeat protein
MTQASIRRFVTVVRSDVQGSTSLAERHDPELVRRILARYYGVARAAFMYHGASAEQIQGDGVMAVFDGYEDDALRAVRAATELRDGMARLNEALERDAGIRLPIRVAVDSGEVVAVAGADDPGQLAGGVMNVVAALEQAARPGEIVLGEATYRLVREAVDVQETGPLSLKGKAEPVSAYRLLFIVPGVTGRVHPVVPMVGREREQVLLEAAWERTVANRSCHLVTVLGVAGVGKSRLVDELVSAVLPYATVLRGRCPSYGGVTYDAIIQVVAEAAELELTDPAGTRARLAALVAGVDGGDRIAERVGQVLGVRKGAGPPEATHWALRRLLEILARKRPLIVVLDDLHWADPALLDLIEDIAESSRDAPLLLVCLARSELIDVRGRWAGGKMDAVSIRLAPLEPREAEQLLSHLLGGVAPAPGVQQYIVDRSGGNPLFVQGLVAMLREERLLRLDEGRWRAAAEELTTPRDIQALLLARLNRLEPSERRVIERAAVIGRLFTLEAVRELSPHAERAQLAASLRALARKDLITPDSDEPGRVQPDQGFSFTHMLIQEVAYGAIAKEVRAELHVQVSDWLVRTSGGDLAQIDEIVGHHLELAHRNLVEVGLNDEHTVNLARRAGEVLAAAGHRAAIRRDIPESAVSLLKRAESLLRTNDETHRTVLLDLGDALRDARRLELALDAYARAIDEADAAGDRTRMRHGMLGVLEVKGFLGLEDPFPGGSTAVVEESLRLFALGRDDLGLAKAWRAKAYAHWTEGRLTEAEEASRRAIEFARRVGDEPLEARTISSHCFILFWGPKHVDDVSRYVKPALGWARGRGIWSLEVDALRILARIAAVQDRPPAARALLREADEAQPPRTESRGDLLVSVGEYLSIAIVELMGGEPAAAERALRDGYREIGDLQGPGQGAGQLVSLVVLLARALALQGRDEEAMEATQECERAAKENQLDAQIKWRSIRSVLLARRGAFDAAERLIQEALDLTAGWEQIDSTAEILADQAYVFRLAGEEEQARRAAAAAIELYERKGNLVGARRVGALRSGGR